MKIGYVGLFHFPDGNAGAFHVLGIGRALRERGHSVVYFGVEKPLPPGIGQTGNVQDDEGSNCEGFRFSSPEPTGEGSVGNLQRQISLASGSSFIRRLSTEEASSGPFDAIIVYHPQSLWIFRLLKWCRSRHIPLFCDVVEWFDRNHVKGGRYGFRALDSEFRMRKGHTLSDGILAISTYLEKYYSGRGVPTLRVPNLVDVTEDKWGKREPLPAKTGHERLVLAFVGTAEQKDFLVNAIRGLSLAGSEKCRIVAVGPSREELRATLGPDSSLLDTLHESLHFTGRLPHRDALRKLAEADFSILLRPDSQFAHAGFPTKLVESLGVGVPVICNLTGDIGLYVKDGYEGIVVPDCTPEAFAEGIRRILAMTLNERLAMRQHARKRAEDSFDYHYWVSPIGNFIEKVAGNVSKTN